MAFYIKPSCVDVTFTFEHLCSEEQQADIRGRNHATIATMHYCVNDTFLYVGAEAGDSSALHGDCWQCRNMRWQTQRQ